MIIPKIMKNPTAVHDFMNDPVHRNPNPIHVFPPGWASLSLSDGYPGLLLLFSALQDDETSHAYVLKIKATLEAQGIPQNLSLFSGLCGICFALQSASKNGTRYPRMLESLHGILLKKIESDYLAPMRENIRTNTPSSSALYDAIQGLSGIGRYALEIPSFEGAAHEIVKTLIAFTRPLTIDGHRVPGWYAPATDILNQFKEANPKGNFNLGLAHGIPGVLSFLSIASLRGIEVEGQKEAIAAVSDWILKHYRLKKWPYYISWEEEIGNQEPPSGSRDAWCYGAPGISSTLFLAGKALNNENLKQFATKAFLDIFSRTREAWNLPGPGICHGISGLLLIANVMAKEKVPELREVLLSYYNPDFPFGFQDVEPCSNGGYAAVSKVTLLEGATGVFLTLNNPSTNWSLPLLIHE